MVQRERREVLGTAQPRSSADDISWPRMVEPSFRIYDPGLDEAALVDLLTTEPWPHRPRPALSEGDVRADLDQGHYAGEAVLTVLIELEGAVVGLVRAEDAGLDRRDPQLDFRLRERARGRGIGLAALHHITGAVFSRYPETLRIEGQTRRDNVAMRKVFVRGGYVQGGGVPARLADARRPSAGRNRLRHPARRLGVGHDDAGRVGLSGARS